MRLLLIFYIYVLIRMVAWHYIQHNTHYVVIVMMLYVSMPLRVRGAYVAYRTWLPYVM